MIELETDRSVATRTRGRPRAFDTDAALDKAIGVFSERGYHGASISDLAEAMQLTAGSLYKAFTDKRGILLAAFDRYRAIRSAKLQDAVATATSGRDKIQAALTFYAEAAHGPAGQQGCLVVSTATELAASDPLAASRVAAAHAANEALMLDLILMGQSDGSVPVRIDAEQTARTLLCLLQGMRVIGKTGRTGDEMRSVVEAAMRLLD